MADEVTEESADRRVRVAWADDAFGIGRVQFASWSEHYASLLPTGALLGADADSFALAWEGSLTSPPTARHRVLVALQGEQVVGFAALAPSDDSDADEQVAELLALHVRPESQGHGHGSRLLAAALDTLGSDGFLTVTTWLLTRDDRTAGFLRGAGWAPDGAAREVEVSDAEGVAHRVSQVRWHVGVPRD